jgi:hypothetical protein
MCFGKIKVTLGTGTTTSQLIRCTRPQFSTIAYIYVAGLRIWIYGIIIINIYYNL